MKINEKYRIRRGVLGSSPADGNNGFFVIPHFRIKGYELCCQVSDGMGWEHVSVTVAPHGRKPTRCPTWEEMCWVKDQFWNETEQVIQYHPPKSEYISMHPFCLHLWKPIGKEVPAPPAIMVGINL